MLHLKIQSLSIAVPSTTEKPKKQPKVKCLDKRTKTT